jgi:RecA-family ATPase
MTEPMPISNDNVITPTPDGVKPKPDQIKSDWEKGLAGLPTSLRSRVTLAYTKAIKDCLTNDPDPSLESLLPRLRITESATIMAKVLPPMSWIVPDYLPAGMTFISGKPKVGKSWLALQLALSVMTGGKVFNKDIEPGRVLYLALEDNERRLQDRMKKQNWPCTQSIDIMLYDDFRDQIGSLDSGGGKRLLAYIENNNYRLVIIDTFSRAVQGDQLDKQAMDQSVGPLQQYALRVNIGMVIIDHMPKSTNNSMDPIAHLYGSVAKSGVGDTFWALYKEQGKRGAKLAITGRDIDEYELQLVFDQHGFYWYCEGNAYDIALTAQRRELLEIIDELDNSPLSEISTALGRDSSNTLKKLNDLQNSGLIRKERGLYELTDLGKKAIL